MFSRPGHLNTVFTLIGFIVAAYGGYLWMQIEPLDEASINRQVEEGFKQEMWRMEQHQARRLAEAKDKLSGMSPEEQARLLYQASAPITLTPEQEQMHKKAIRRDITESHAYRKKKATSLLFLGGALLFMTLTPKLVQRLMSGPENKPG